jgi:hypothetical protein
LIIAILSFCAYFLRFSARRLSGFVAFADAASPDQAKDFVRAEASSSRQGTAG